MKIPRLLCSFSAFFFFAILPGRTVPMSLCPDFSGPGIQDTLIANQILYNGRAWRNMYTAVKGDPYLFSKEFLTGSVTISGRTFQNNQLHYDIVKDEVVILTNKKLILVLNKELSEAFTLDWNGKTYRFVKFTSDSTKVLSGYLNELYKGRSALYVKYTKKIVEGSVEDKYDGFVQSFRIFVVKDGLPYEVRTKRQLLSVFRENKQKLTGYIRSNKLTVTGNNPLTFVPVVEYYDSLTGSK